MQETGKFVHVVGCVACVGEELGNTLALCYRVDGEWVATYWVDHNPPGSALHNHLGLGFDW